MNLYEWANRWKIPWEAVADLKANVFYLDGDSRESKYGTPVNEEGVSALIRMEASQNGMRMWRNNVGAMKREDGSGFVRFGLANDSVTVNRNIKSADLIGINPVKITAAHVGHTVGQFVSREVKRPGWKYTGTEREEAQQRWAELITRFGGDAAFATGAGTL